MWEYFTLDNNNSKNIQSTSTCFKFVQDTESVRFTFGTKFACRIVTVNIRRAGIESVERVSPRVVVGKIQ